MCLYSLHVIILKSVPSNIQCVFCQANIRSYQILISLIIGFHDLTQRLIRSSPSNTGLLDFGWLCKSPKKGLDNEDMTQDHRTTISFI